MDHAAAYGRSRYAAQSRFVPLVADNVTMPRRPHAAQPPIEPREFRSVDEIDRGIKKLQRRIEELRNLDARAAILEHSGADDVVRSNIKETIRDVFGPNSPEFQEHERIHIWAGPSYMGMSPEAVVEGTERGKIHVIAILQGLVDRLQERREEIVDDTTPSPTRYFEQLNPNSLSCKQMPKVRVELTRGCPHRILSPARLPFRHSGKWAGNIAEFSRG